MLGVGECANLFGQVVVEVGDHVPEHVAARRGDEEGPLADGGGRVRADAGDAGTFGGELALVPGGAQFSQRRPLLAGPADVLPVVGADRAVLARSAVLNPAGLADGHVCFHDHRYTSRAAGATRA
jgi:hypothetical protein